MATFDSFFNKVLFSGKYRIVRHLLFQLPIFMMSLNAFGAADGRIFDFSRQNVPQWLIMYAYLLTCKYLHTNAAILLQRQDSEIHHFHNSAFAAVRCFEGFVGSFCELRRS